MSVRVTVARAAVLALALSLAPHARAAGDLSGVWSWAGADKTFRSNPDSAWSHDKLPFTAQGRAAVEANHPGKGPRLMHNPRERNDPLVQGNPPGLLRTLIYMASFEFVQTQGKVLQKFSLGRVFRDIYMDGRSVPPVVAEVPRWYGYSLGHWDGDTLVVQTSALDSRAWMDDWGTPFTDDVRVEERWNRIAPDKLQLQITVTDPALYSKPWVSQQVVYSLRPKGQDLGEDIHAPVDEQRFSEVITHPAGGL